MYHPISMNYGAKSRDLKGLGVNVLFILVWRITHWTREK